VVDTGEDPEGAKGEVNHKRRQKDETKGTCFTRFPYLPAALGYSWLKAN